jgi:hypothetical protein
MTGRGTVAEQVRDGRTHCRECGALAEVGGKGVSWRSLCARCRKAQQRDRTARR